MGNYTIFWMFENPGRGRQARNFTTTTDIFGKLTLGARELCAGYVDTRGCV